MSLFSYVLNHVSKEAYYKNRLEEWNGIQGSNVSCPFHGEDNNPSFSVNIGAIGGCYCHACKEKIGNIVHFEKKISEKEISDEEAAQIIYRDFIRPVLSFAGEKNEYLEQVHNNLLEDEKIQKTIFRELRFSISSIKKFKLGWDFSIRRLVIPVFDQWNNLVNFRYYSLPSFRTDKTKVKIYNHEGYGKVSLFPLNLTESTLNNEKVIYWLTSERDVILAWTLGLQAICSTGGENNIQAEFGTYFIKLGYRVIVVGDNDKVGETARKAKIVFLENNKIKNGWIKLPPIEKDFSDWIINQDKSVADFKSLPVEVSDNTPFILTPQVDIQLAPGYVDVTQTPLDSHFEVIDIANRAEILNNAIEVKGTIVSHSARVWAIPYVFEVGNTLYRVPYHRDLLHMLNKDDVEVDKIAKKIFGTSRSCRPVSYLTVTEVEIIPVITPGVDSSYVVQKCFHFGPNMEVNLPRKFKLIPTTRVHNQETVAMIYDSDPISDVLGATRVRPEDYEFLQHKFTPKGVKAKDIVRQICELVDELAIRCTLISNRQDLHIAQLLTWSSPLQFYFHREGLQRGWLNTLALGDTQTGKSVISQKYCELFKCGTFISSENCSFVGLIGGAIKGPQGMFVLRWGKIPLYNKQLVVLEELSGLSTVEISRMSDVRSSGVARLDKGGLTGETPAKTRLLFISNVRKQGANIDSYVTGVQAVQDLIGQNEDISRFDLIVAVTDREVSNEIINSRERYLQVVNPYSEEEKELFRKLMIFIWNLQPEQIDLTEEACLECLNQTNELATIYHSSIPIFKAGSGRLKLARIAVAVACLTFNYNIEQGKIIVTEEHVKAAVIILREFYDKPSLGYLKYSKQQFLKETVVNENKLEVTISKYIRSADIKFSLFQYLLYNGTFEREELAQALNIESSIVEKLTSTMFLSNIIKKAAGYKLAWEITPAGKFWIEKKIQSMEMSDV